MRQGSQQTGAPAQVGTVTDVRFTNISAVAEAGIVVAGSPGSTIEGLVLEGLQLELTRQTDVPGGFLDYRPGLRGLVDDVTTSAIFLEHANHATLSNVEVPASFVLLLKPRYVSLRSKWRFRHAVSVVDSTRHERAICMRNEGLRHGYWGPDLPRVIMCVSGAWSVEW